MRIVYLGAPAGLHALEQVVAGRLEVEAVEETPEAVARGLASADALLDASMRVRITDAMLKASPRLRIISCATTGSDHIERGELGQRGIELATLREDAELLRGLTPAAELSWALLLACARRLPAACADVRAGHWVRERFPGVMLRGRQLGLVGCGRIGSWMARYGEAFGMRVAAHDPHVDVLPSFVQRLSLEALFETSDFVSIHVHLSEATRGLVSRALLERLKPSAILINTSRGGLLDERALLEQLRAGRLAAAGLDVLDGEPDVARHPLVEHARQHQNLLITPHCGGYSPDAVARVCARAAEKILRHLGVAP